MKRFIIVCLCLSLLSLLIIPVFAEEVVLRNIEPSVSYTSLSFYRSVTYTHNPFSTTVSSSGYVVVGSSVITFEALASSQYDNRPVLLIGSSNFSDETTLISSNGSLVSGWDGIIYFDSVTSFPLNFVNWYNSFPNGVDGNVSDGVSSFISWTGNVLTDLVSNPSILVLVGLSIAMLAVLPWGISKIKSLIKGY